MTRSQIIERLLNAHLDMDFQEQGTLELSLINDPDDNSLDEQEIINTHEELINTSTYDLHEEIILQTHKNFIKTIIQTKTKLNKNI